MRRREVVGSAPFETVHLCPIRRLQVFDDIDAVLVKKRKEGLEGVDDMLVQVAAVVDDDIDFADVSNDSFKKRCIGLASAVRFDSSLVVIAFVVNIDSKDVALREISLPALQRSPAMFGTLMA